MSFTGDLSADQVVQALNNELNGNPADGQFTARRQVSIDHKFGGNPQDPVNWESRISQNPDLLRINKFVSWNNNCKSIGQSKNNEEYKAALINTPMLFLEAVKPLGQLFALYFKQETNSCQQKTYNILQDYHLIYLKMDAALEIWMIQQDYQVKLDMKDDQVQIIYHLNFMAPRLRDEYYYYPNPTRPQYTDLSQLPSDLSIFKIISTD
ncbi:hypothetical protein ABPG73_008236 [Tetrahymena malaccensis]